MIDVEKNSKVGFCDWSSGQHACLLSGDPSSNPAEVYNCY